MRERRVQVAFRPASPTTKALLNRADSISEARIISPFFTASTTYSAFVKINSEPAFPTRIAGLLSLVPVYQHACLLHGTRRALQAVI
ncbi:MAG: hypothetical protein GY820_07595 [Gammaproteobacteria bacterium]|nr:hypothetical protein [Gammaproteobacteria bacterium]